MYQLHVEAPRRQAGISSLILSGISALAFVLVLFFGASVSTALTCFNHLSYPNGLVGFLCLTPIYLSSLLAIVLSFIAKRVGNKAGLVLSARLLGIILFTLYILLSPLLFALLYWFDSPVSC